MMLGMCMKCEHNIKVAGHSVLVNFTRSRNRDYCVSFITFTPIHSKYNPNLRFVRHHDGYSRSTFSNSVNFQKHITHTQSRKYIHASNTAFYATKLFSRKFDVKREKKSECER